MDAGDGSGHRRRFAMVGLGLTEVKTIGIGENFAIFLRRFRIRLISKFAKTRANFPFSLTGFCSFLSELLFCSFNCNLFPFFVKISANFGEIAEIRDLGVLGRRGSRVADESCPACPNTFFLGRLGSWAAGGRCPAQLGLPEK
ncbi:hypothetical protein CRG98_042973 [Punica granatum]|uniref:Uncharacterized protein n=1 Tax=Punica granatum TaxID=22663 RepID=A0A2I0HY70_PUNGR|nr:hypothetical protein CRG98_042973 [Punica granatum]